jgi:uncharacterized protein YjiS (DUF1127 family)
MSLLNPTTRSILQSYRDYRVRRKAARTLSAMDAAVLKDVGINLPIP